MNEYYVEQEPDGVKVVTYSDGARSVNLIPYPQVLERLNKGEWDDDLNLALSILTSWIEHVGDDRYTDDDVLLVSRFVVSSHFYNYQAKKNGTVNVEVTPGKFGECPVYIGKHGGVNLHLATLRMSMILYIESTFLEEFGEKEGLQSIISFYSDMRHPEGGLTSDGIRILSDLHDMLIKSINARENIELPVVH